MAVSKIRKISSTVLLVIAIAAIVILGLFFLGGYVDPTIANPVPKFTDLLIYACYGVFAASLLVLLYFAVVSFFGKFKSNKKGALAGLLSLVGIAALLGITYAIGDSTPLVLGTDAAKYNTPGYLKFSDMMLYSIYAMFCLTILALIWGAIRNVFAGKK